MKCIRIMIGVVAYSILVFFLLPYPICCLQISSLDGARNYYTTVSAFIASIIGITSLFIGSYYYFDKERRNKILLIRQAIEKFDDAVMDIIDLVVSDSSDLYAKRNQLARISDQIELMLDDETGFLPFSRKAAKKVLALNSFVDKNELLMRVDFKELSKASLISIKDHYQEISKSAKIVCYLEYK